MSDPVNSDEPPSEAACPLPLEWHPAYQDKMFLLDWLNETGSYAALHDILLPKLPQEMQICREGEPASPIIPAFDYVTLRRRRCAGPAPYVGRPFIYMWNAAVDEQGRGIAGEARIQYRDTP